MKLTKAQKNLVLEYARLAALSELSELEADRMGEILELAESDDLLSIVINEVDYFILQELHLLDEDSIHHYENQKARIKEFIEPRLSVEQDEYLSVGAEVKPSAEESQAVVSVPEFKVRKQKAHNQLMGTVLGVLAVVGVSGFSYYSNLGGLRSLISGTEQKRELTTSTTVGGIIPDSTLGDKSSVISEVVPQEALTDKIEDGALQGSHLFHSFSESSIEESSSTYFTNPTEIEKVTRARASLQSKKTDVGAKHLGDNSSERPKSYNPNASPPGSLKTRPNASNILGTQDTVRIQDDAIAPFIAAARGQLLDLSRTSQKGEALAEQNFDFMGDPLAPMLRPYRQLLTFARGLLVRRNENDTMVIASTFGVEDAGTVNITATNSVHLDGKSNTEILSGIFSRVASGAEGNSGGIEIETSSLQLTNGAIAITSSTGVGDAGIVNITATNSVHLDGKSNTEIPNGIFSQVASGAKGDSGGIELTTASLEVTNGARVSISTFGVGNAGDISVGNAQSIFLDNNSFIATVVEPTSLDTGGNITFTAPIFNNQFDIDDTVEIKQLDADSSQELYQLLFITDEREESDKQ